MSMYDLIYWGCFVVLWIVFWGSLWLMYKRFWRKYESQHRAKGFYYTKNRRTGEIKKFATFTEYLDWYRHLTQDEMSEYGGWNYMC